MSRDPGQTMADACYATAPAARPYSLSPWPSAGRSARRLIAASQLRRIAPLAGRISHQ